MNIPQLIEMLKNANEKNYRLTCKKVINDFKKIPMNLRVGFLFEKMDLYDENVFEKEREKFAFDREFKYKKLSPQAVYYYDLLLKHIKDDICEIKDLKIVDMSPALPQAHYVKFNFVFCNKDKELRNKFSEKIHNNLKDEKILIIDFLSKNPYTIKSIKSKYFRPKCSEYIFNNDIPYQNFIFNLIKHRPKSYSEFVEYLNKLENEFKLCYNNKK